MVHTIVETDMKYMDGPITKEELINAIKSAPKNKSPGEDGITAEFYKWSKDIMTNDLLQVYNSFFETGKIPKEITRGVIVCLSKSNRPKTVSDYRPLTLLNTDYKIYARVLANRIKMTMRDIISDTQYSAAPGRNILDAATGIRDVIAVGQNTQNGFCLLTIDFERAFDNVAHEYLKYILARYKYGAKMIKAIMSLYEIATSRVNINGHYTGDIAIKCSIRQGCPISSLLYAMILDPFLKLLHTRLRGLKIGTEKKKIVWHTLMTSV